MRCSSLSKILKNYSFTSHIYRLTCTFRLCLCFWRIVFVYFVFFIETKWERFGCQYLAHGLCSMWTVGGCVSNQWPPDLQKAVRLQNAVLSECQLPLSRPLTFPPFEADDGPPWVLFCKKISFRKDFGRDFCVWLKHILNRGKVALQWYATLYSIVCTQSK